MASFESGPLVGVIMGSDSDWRVMEGAVAALRELGVPFEARVVSAHRSPREMADYAETARGRGLAVIIAGAGGAAHLPGMVAAHTTLPVIGVPVCVGSLGGADALHAIAQMPRGVPVATVAIDGAFNAGLLAAQILGSGRDPRADEIAGRLATYKDGLKTAALAKRLPVERG